MRLLTSAQKSAKGVVGTVESRTEGLNERRGKYNTCSRSSYNSQSDRVLRQLVNG